ncbi:MAG: DNA polymerase III subunit chi [Betaproteobacteria bacterium HGW-Betaproteobacteria-11]|nr:MAG: DNA polymerase III subunit chi [Betaproteobacteria bacterium HGW-Betaproteobacteria-11]
MTKITFLHGASDRFQAAVTWLAAAYSKGTRVIVYAPLDAPTIDQRLWTQPATGFIPHCRANSPLATETPVLIATDLECIAHDECLLNLSDEIPPGFSRFVGLTEIVSTSDSDRLPGRERFRIYREQGYPLESRNIATEF